MCKVWILLVCVSMSGVLSQPFPVIGEFSNSAFSIGSVVNGGSQQDFGLSTAFNNDGVINQGFVDALTGSGGFYLASGTEAGTEGANDQTSQGVSNSSATLLNPVFATRGSGFSFGEGNNLARVYPDQTGFGNGSSTAFTANTIVSSIGFDPVPQYTSSTASFNSTALRDGIGASRAYGLSSTDSVTLDAGEYSGSVANSIGGSDGIAIGANTFAESAGVTFSRTDAESASAGCDMSSSAGGGTTGAPEDAIASRSNCTAFAQRQTFKP
eukprot:TRINITY_DN7695_c0_g1_i3.p1 TRINITY_DN7695_c0_g1~~TRINITY_DN7695_c0_g1_i3.p1  ORF type:complete len:269 (-),score=63.59 TRINITY_DN7695_c0_g1_i3:1138-1944(-)